MTENRSAFIDVFDEKFRLTENTGKQTYSPVEWIAMVNEKLGECSKKALEFHFGVRGTKEIIDKNLNEYRKSMVTVAAIAMQAIECLDRKIGNYNQQCKL